jgi:hypothetical protein
MKTFAILAMTLCIQIGFGSAAFAECKSDYAGASDLIRTTLKESSIGGWWKVNSYMMRLSSSSRGGGLIVFLRDKTGLHNFGASACSNGNGIDLDVETIGQVNLQKQNGGVWVTGGDGSRALLTR